VDRAVGGAHRYGEWAARLAPWLVGLVALGIYAATAAPSIVAFFDDTLEFQLVLPTFGIAHPTGYPLYTILGGVWSRLVLPFGNWAWRTNLFSAFAAAAAVALVFALAGRLTPGADGKTRPWAGLAAAPVFALGPVWWSQATVAEVYALHNLLVVAILLVACRLPAQPGAAFDRQMTLLFLLVGLGIAHHRTILLLAPALAIYLLWRMPLLLRPRRIWLFWLVALLAPLLLYLYLPLRAAAGVQDLHGSYANTWDGFWAHVLASGYTGFFGTTALAETRTSGDWLALWLAQTGWLGAGLTVAGLAWLADRRVRKEWVLVLLVLLANLVFALAYRVGDQEVFLLPVFLCTALLTGGGLAAVTRRLPGHWATAAGVLGLLVLAAGPGRGPWVNRSHDWAAHDAAVDMAKVDFPAGSVVIGLEGEATALKYMQLAEGLGLNATAMVADDPALRRAVLADAVAAGQPVYLTRELEGIADQYSFAGEGPLVRVWPRAEADTGPPLAPLPAPWPAQAIALDGYAMERLQWAGGPVLRVLLDWRPAAAQAATYKVSLRLLDADGNQIVYPDGMPAVVDELPLRQVASTADWVPGEVVRDVHELRLPPGASTAARLLVILYDAATLAEAGRIELPLPP
jgi:hypothetical protein